MAYNHLVDKENWRYVALGDSFIWGFGDLFTSHIQSDLGVRVAFEDHSAGGQRSSDLLMTLQENNALRTKLCDAEVITFMIPMALFKEPSITYLEELSKGINNQDGMRKNFELYQQDVDGIFDELLSLRNPSEAIIRVMDCYLPPFLFGEWMRQGAYVQLKAWWDAFNDYVARIASEKCIPLAHVRLAFNGPDGDKNPGEFISEDGWHTNEHGAALIAGLHRELGYSPLRS